MTSTEPRRRWSLRAKLTALVMVTAAIALAAVDVLLPLNLRSSLLSTRDATLTAVISSVPQGHTFDLQSLLSVSTTNPLRGEVGWSIVSAEGTVKSAPPPTGDSSGSPDIPADPTVGEPTTV